MRDAPTSADTDLLVETDTDPLDEFHETINAFKALRSSDKQAALSIRGFDRSCAYLAVGVTSGAT